MSILGNSGFALTYKLDQMQKEIKEIKKETEKAEKKKKEETPLAQQLLLLHYLGLINEIDLTTKSKSILLSKVLNRSMDNIRKNITYINSPKISLSKIKNTENLEAVLRIFESLKMSEVVAKVNLDLNKLKEK